MRLCIDARGLVITYTECIHVLITIALSVTLVASAKKTNYDHS